MGKIKSIILHMNRDTKHWLQGGQDNFKCNSGKIFLVYFSLHNKIKKKKIILFMLENITITEKVFWCPKENE